MISQEFFRLTLETSRTGYPTGAVSDCELAAETAGQRRLATSSCSVSESQPVCIRSVWASTPVKHSDGSCTIFIRICYNYSEKWWKKYVDERDHETVKIAIGTSPSFRFSTVREWSIYLPQSTGKDINEGYILDSVTIQANSGIDSVIVGDSWEELIWDSVAIPALGCGKLPDATGSIYVSGINRSCTECYIWIRWLEGDPYRRGNTIIIRDGHGKEIYRKTLINPDPNRANEEYEAKIAIPCQGLSPLVRRGGVIDVYNVWRETWVRNIPIPDFVDIEPYQKELYAPSIGIRRLVWPGSSPCNYLVSVESRNVSTDRHKVYLFKGRLSEAEHADIEDIFKNKRYYIFNSNDDSLKLLSVDDFIHDHNVVSHNLRGPGVFTIVVEVGTCVYSRTIELPGCGSSRRLPDGIKVLDEEGDFVQDSTPRHGYIVPSGATSPVSFVDEQDSNDPLNQFGLKKVLS